MSYLLDNIPYFYCLVRREYTQNMQEGHGEYLKAVAFAVWCRRGCMLGFQTMFLGENEQGAPNNTGGAMFSQVPLEALCWKPCDKPAGHLIAPWDVFSESFTVVALELIHKSKTFVLPDRAPGRYLFTIDYTRADLADDPDQHKQHHVLKMDDGWFAAVPNNRLLVLDPAFWKVSEDTPRFRSLSGEFRSE